MHLWHLNNMKVILTLWTLNYVDCVPFVVLILSLLFTSEPNNLEKSYSRISEKHDQTSINLIVWLMQRKPYPTSKMDLFVTEIR